MKIFKQKNIKVITIEGPIKAYEKMDFLSKKTLLNY